MTHDVTAFALVAGSPARLIGWVSKAGHRLNLPASGEAEAVCEETGEAYVLEGSDSPVQRRMTSEQDGTPAEIDLVMISNFGASDGGRETWAHQFLPRLLKELPGLRLNILGLRVDGEPDNSDAVREAVGPEADRLDQNYLRTGASPLPNSLLFVCLLRKASKARGRAAPTILAVGSVMELLAILMSPEMRKSRKILWLRTIWSHEKAARIPAALRWAAEAFERRILRHADLLIANGEDTADFYRGRGFKVEVIPNAVDLGRWTIDPPMLAASVRIGFVGRVIEEKSYREFIGAAELLREDPRFEFSIIGGPTNPIVGEAARDGSVSYRPAVRTMK